MLLLAWMVVAFGLGKIAVVGVAFVTLEEIAREVLAAPERVPHREIVRITLPGRAGEVTGSEPL